MRYRNLEIDTDSWRALGLGSMPDTEFAKVVNLSPSIVAHVRCKLRIAPAARRAPVRDLMAIRRETWPWYAAGLGRFPLSVVARNMGVSKSRVRQIRDKLRRGA